jgi:holo-[acyl-carrier protein] synthase
MSTPPSVPGLGLALVEVSRFRRALERHGEGLRRRVFTEAEWAYAASRGADGAAVLAVRFAAKEAVLKALGTGWGRGASWRDVEVVGGGRAAPLLRLSGRSLERAQGLGVRVQVSLSHAGDVAGAVAMLVPAPR